MIQTSMMRGRMILSKEMPAAKFPKVIRDANNTASGSDKGTRLNAE